MKINRHIVEIAICIAIAAMVVQGCALHRINLVTKGVVTVERIPTKRVCVVSAYVLQDGDEIIVAGRVKPCPPRDTVTTGGHVDISIFDPDGTLLKQVTSRYVPRIIPRKRMRSSRYQAFIPMVLPQGSKVRVGFHDSPHSSNKI